jgi:aryl-alcohol dehydrogenase-like predicted oxidoreductase
MDYRRLGASGFTVPVLSFGKRPTVSSVIIGARNEEQLRQNLGAVGWNLTPEQVRRLDEASGKPAAYPYWHQAFFAERNPPSV